MVVVAAIEIFDVQRQAAVLREGLEKLAEEFRIHLAKLGRGEAHLPDEIGSPETSSATRVKVSSMGKCTLA